MKLLKFDSVDEGREIVSSLPKCLEVPISYLNHEYDEVYIDGYKGLLNTTTNEIANIVSDQYVPLQHEEAYTNFFDAVEGIGLEVTGQFRVGENIANLEYVVPDAELIADDSDGGIKIGGRVRNSYDSSTTFSASGFAFRVLCSNGMFLGATDVNGTKFRAMHRATPMENSPDFIAKHVVALLDNTSQYQDVIDRARDFDISYDDEIQFRNVMTSYLPSARVAERIIDDQWNGELNTTKWELYNDVTEYASHNDLSNSMYERIQNSAERILLPECDLAVMNPKLKAVA